MKFQTYTDKSGLTRWRLVAANGRIVADSGEGYDNAYNCRRAIRSLTEFHRLAREVHIDDRVTGRTHTIEVPKD